MDKLQLTAFDIAQRFAGLKEVPGSVANPTVLAMLRLDNPNIADDETPWCSAFVNYVCWLLRLPRSRSLAARSWLAVGQPIPLAAATPGFDIVVLSRGEGNQPDASVLAAPGHVGFFAAFDVGRQLVHILGGNQSNMVSVAPFAVDRVLGVRRLYA